MSGEKIYPASGFALTRSHLTAEKFHKLYQQSIDDPDEFWAEQATKKICEISENAPEHVKQQAYAFRNHVYTVILLAIKSGISSDRTTVVNLLNKQGHGDMAKIIKEL